MQTLNDALGLGQPKSQPIGEMAPMDIYTPPDVEDIFNERPEPFKDPRRPTRVEYADASGSVPLPTRAPDASQIRDDPEAVPMPERGERSPNMFKGPLIQPNDSRYVDTTNVIVADTILGGLLPWVQAVADVATGRVPVEQMDAARMEHEKRIEELKSGHPNVVSAAEKAMPFLSGLGLGIMKPARTVAGTVGRGMAVGGVEGAVQGFTSGDPEMSSADPDRLTNAVAGGATSAVLGGFGASLPAAAAEGKAMLGRRAARIEREDAAAAASEKRRLAAEKRQATKAANERRKALEESERKRDDQLVSRFESYREVTGTPVERWKQNRESLNTQPEAVFKAQAARNATLDDFSRMVNLPPVAILQKLRGKEIKLETPQERSLYKQLEEVEESWQAVRRRGTKVEPNAPASPNAGPPAASAAATAKPKSAAARPDAAAGKPRGGTKRTRTKPAPAAPEPRKPGDESIRVPRKPQRDDREY